jgi:predicted regulator of Ras-like GTPase activity (Roadblock/LC7/MglB family)
MPLSIYGHILADMLRSLPDATAAVFADWEGEAVDNAGELSDTDIRLAGAHWGIVYFLVRDALERSGAGAPAELVLRFRSRQVIVRHITDQYFVVVESQENALVSRTLRALEQARELLLEQM